jgi:hypothetical protein
MRRKITLYSQNSYLHLHTKLRRSSAPKAQPSAPELQNKIFE